MALEINSLSLGKTVLNYKIEQIIGHGGMGVVVKAKDLKLNRPVALKFLSSQLSTNHEAIQQIQREAIVSSNVNHPGICTIFAIETIESQSFLVMEFLEGQTLSQILEKNGPLPEQQVLGIVQQICTALKSAHSAGVVHRDIKPENIMLSPKTQKIKIMDFGVAKLAEDLAKNISERNPLYDLEQTENINQFSPNQLSITFSGFMGTSSYMSPEQCLAYPIDHRSDIFSLGILIYELLTNQKPFVGNGHLKIMQNIVETDPIPLNNINSHFKNEWNAILARLLEKDVTKRFQSIEELVKTLDIVHSKRNFEKKGLKSFFLLAPESVAL
jgi:eukaryotic-like serine/threonine-protein kinase